MSIEQDAINSQYDDLKNVILEAAKIKSDINSTCKETMKTLKNEFSDFMLDNVDSGFASICEQLGMFNGFADLEDKKKREKKSKSSMKSFFGKMFKVTSDFENTKKGGKPKDTTPPKAHSYIMNMVASLYASRVIPEVQHALNVAGIEIRFTKPITKLDLSNEDDKNTILSYIEKASNVQDEIFEKNAEIEDVIFESIPEDMKFDSEGNPKGIKKSQFQALAELQSKTDELSMNGDSEKAEAAVEKQCDTHFANSKNQEMLALVTELILTKNNEPAKPESWDEALGGTEAETELEPEPEKDELPDNPGELSALIPDELS